MNSKRKGGIAIGEAIAYFISQGITVLLPVADCDKYDIVIDDGGLQKIQVKYTDSRSQYGSFGVNLRTFGGYREKVYESVYKEGDFDFLFVFCSNRNMYLIPAQRVVGKKTITVGKAWTGYRVNLPM